MTKQYKVAQVKFNGGRGALLCDGCSVIVAYGFEHEDRKHYCDKCKDRKNESQDKQLSQQTNLQHTQ